MRCPRQAARAPSDGCSSDNALADPESRWGQAFCLHCGYDRDVKSGRRRVLAFTVDEAQVEALRRYARKQRDERRSVSRLIREAIADYLAAHAVGVRVSEPLWWGRAGSGKTPPRIMLHLRDAKRLEVLWLQAKTLPGTHRTVGRVIRAAIDEYLEAHETERRKFLERKRSVLPPGEYPRWKRWVAGGEGQPRVSSRRRKAK